jgi:hypothetical protein
MLFENPDASSVGPSAMSRLRCRPSVADATLEATCLFVNKMSSRESKIYGHHRRTSENKNTTDSNYEVVVLGRSPQEHDRSFGAVKCSREVLDRAFRHGEIGSWKEPKAREL